METMRYKDAKKGHKAVASHLRISPTKVRPIADLVRLKKYDAAMNILNNMPHKGARLIRKVIQSAVANALNINNKLDEDMLYIRDLQINEGPRMKRIWIRGRGRADKLLKRLCHITVIVDEIEQ